MCKTSFGRRWGARPPGRSSRACAASRSWRVTPRSTVVLPRQLPPSSCRRRTGPPCRCRRWLRCGRSSITRENGQRFITVQCNVVDRDIGSFVAEGQVAIKRKVDLPPGYLVTWGGQFELQRQANKRLVLVVPVTLLLIFVLLYVSFHSLRSTALILLNIPLALVGGVAALWISGQNLSVPASGDGRHWRPGHLDRADSVGAAGDFPVVCGGVGRGCVNE